MQRTIGDGHDLRGNRFKGNPKLEAVFDGESTLQRGATGLPVTILQQALADAAFASTVNGQFGPRTRDAVRAFQTAKGLTGAAAGGVINAATMDLLDQHFLGHAPERAIATHATRALTEGTRALSPAEQSALRAAVTTEQRTAGGRCRRSTRPSPPARTRTRSASATPSTPTSPPSTPASSRPARHGHPPT